MIEGAKATVGVQVSADRTYEPNLAVPSGPVMYAWGVIGETVPGASHLRAGTPNQDAILQMRESSVGLPIVLAISDGHGSDKCFRSDSGSRLAVSIGLALMYETLIGFHQESDAHQVEVKIKEKLPAEFARRWKSAVETDLERKPLTAEELDRLEQKDGAQGRQAVETHPSLAYGATALAVGLIQSFVIYLQLGDGEIITVSETGEVSKPLSEDERLMANETTSLCADSAAQDFRFACQPLPDPPPALILMTTDGYANSFADDAGFLQVGSDILEILRADGFDAVNRGVRGWLEEATQMGSGDDCTLGIICRMDALKKIGPADSAVVEPGAQKLSTLAEAIESAGTEEAEALGQK